MRFFDCSGGLCFVFCVFFFFQAEDGIRDRTVTGVQTCDLPILGDACDNPAMVDGDNHGIPDDVVSFGLQVNCSRLPLPNIVIEAVAVRDVPGTGGDNDAFCDTGETCEMTVALVNNGPVALSDVTLHLATSDPDIACLEVASVDIGALPVGGRVDTANVGAGHLRLPFRYRVSAGPTTVSAAEPAMGPSTLVLD